MAKNNSYTSLFTAEKDVAAGAITKYRDAGLAGAANTMDLLQAVTGAINAIGTGLPTDPTWTTSVQTAKNNSYTSLFAAEQDVAAGAIRKYKRRGGKGSDHGSALVNR